MKSRFKDILSYIFGPKSWVDENWHAPDNHVAAGDPAHGGMASNLPTDFPEKFNFDGTEIITDEYETFVVDGSSMAAEDISNGMVLLCKKTDAADIQTIGIGKYLIVKIDSEYYKHKDKKVNFKHKLRRSVADVPQNPDQNQFLDALKRNVDSLLIAKNQEAFKKKFEDTYSFYDKEESMILSITYRDGHVRYSFHPKRLVEYVAEYVVAMRDGRYEIRKV